MSLNLVLVCDRCATQIGQTSDLTIPLGQVSRAQAKAEGWRIQARNVACQDGTGFQDYCDECFDSFLCSPAGDAEHDRITAERAKL